LFDDRFASSQPICQREAVQQIFDFSKGEATALFSRLELLSHLSVKLKDVLAGMS